MLFRKEFNTVCEYTTKSMCDECIDYSLSVQLRSCVFCYYLNSYGQLTVSITYSWVYTLHFFFLVIFQ